MVFYGKGEIRDIDSIVLILLFIRSLSPFLSAVKKRDLSLRISFVADFYSSNLLTIHEGKGESNNYE